MKNKSGSGILVIVLSVLAALFLGFGGIPALIRGIFNLAMVIGILLIVLVIAVVVIALAGTNKEAKDKEETQAASGPVSLNGSKGTLRQEGKKLNNLTPEQTAVLAKGKRNLIELKAILARIKSGRIRRRGMENCEIIEKILNTLREEPEQIPEVRQFLNYYLPTLGEILLKYEKIETSGVKVDESKEKLYDYLDDIRSALNKQYENLFEDDILDLTVEMEAMKMAIKRDGLITGDTMQVKDEKDRVIELTL